jgi:molecular chaperone HtpG
MRKSLTKKVLSTLAEMLEKDRETYIKFWGQFGAAIKEGVTTDNDNKDKLTDLILFRSSESADDKALTTIREYAGRMKPGQEHFFYMTGDTVDVIKNSPHLEIFPREGLRSPLSDRPGDEIVITGIE